MDCVPEILDGCNIWEHTNRRYCVGPLFRSKAFKCSSVDPLFYVPFVVVLLAFISLSLTLP